MSYSRVLDWIFRLVLAAAFLLAGYEKARDPIRFLFDIRSFHLLPDPYAALLALGLPWLELICAAGVLGKLLYAGPPTIILANIALSIAWCRHSSSPWLEVLLLAAIFGKHLYAGSLAVLAASLAVFMAAIAWSWHRGLDVSCGCFGKTEFEMTYTQHLLLNGTLLGMAGWLLWREQRMTRQSKPA